VTLDRDQKRLMKANKKMLARDNGVTVTVTATPTVTVTETVTPKANAQGPAAQMTSAGN